MQKLCRSCNNKVKVFLPKPRNTTFSFVIASLYKENGKTRLYDTLSILIGTFSFLGEFTSWNFLIGL